MKPFIALIIILLIAGFFRFFYLEQYPPGFYSDEASYSYNAYSILKTGQDEYGRQYPTVFEAFGDYKLPVILYSIVGSFALFSPSEWSARFPGALYGLFTIIGLYLFTNKLFQTLSDNPLEKSKSKLIALLSATFLTLSPGHIFVSRGTWELTPALCFLTFGAYALLLALHQIRTTSKLNITGSIALLTTALLFVASLYSYNSARVFVPLFLIGFVVLFHISTRRLLQHSKLITITAALTSLLLILPILATLSSPQVTQRAQYISIFYDQGVQGHLFDIIRADGGQPVQLTRLLHNKPVLYFMDFAQRYLSHFDLNFLFITGDTFEIFRLIGLGFLPLLTAPFLFYGLFKSFISPQPWKKIVLLWLAISPVASSLTIFTPSSSRSMNMIIPLSILSAYGVVSLAQKLQTKWGVASTYLYTVTFTALIIINSAYIFIQYFGKTPQVVAEKWNDGYQETVEYVGKISKNYDRVIISSAQAPSYIFYLWNLRYDPALYHTQAQVNHTPDQHGLNFTKQFGKYYFTKDIKKEILNKATSEKTLYVGFPDEFTDYTRIIYSRNNKPVFIIKE